MDSKLYLPIIFILLLIGYSTLISVNFIKLLYIHDVVYLNIVLSMKYVQKSKLVELS